MRKSSLIFSIIFLGLFYLNNGVGYAQDNDVFRIAGLELPPYGYGYMETQPHHAIDSTNVDFANYYARISLLLSGITNTGDTILTYSHLQSQSDVAAFVPKRLYRDTTNVMGLPGVKFTTISVYDDTSNGWRIAQFNIALLDYSAGILLYLIRYNGQKGTLNNVHTGVVFDFDVPDSENHPTSDDDWLNKFGSAYEIKDFHSHQGIKVHALFNRLIQNYWVRSQTPVNANHLYSITSQNNSTNPQDTADYHFYLGTGPFQVNSGESIVLAYLIQPVNIGFPKTPSMLNTLQIGLEEFSRNKNLASIDQRSVNERPQNENVPIAYQLHQNSPNPFNPTTEIRFDLPMTEMVKLEIFNTLGQKVQTIANEVLGAGYHTFSWDGRDRQGQLVASGVYIYRITTSHFQSQKKMLLVR